MRFLKKEHKNKSIFRHAKNSPLTRRIMAVNVMALAILVGSLLYLGHYRDSLIASEMNGLSMQARMTASAVAEGSVILDKNEQNILSPLLARLMIRHIVQDKETRMRIYDLDDVLIADSLIFFDKTKSIKLEQKTTLSWFNDVAMSFFDFLDRFFGKRQYPIYKEDSGKENGQCKIVVDAKKGEISSKIWKISNGDHLLSVAVPIQRYKQVLGVIILTRTDSKIKESIRNVRHDILKIFSITLLITLLLSMYLAKTIVTPIKILAGAAERVRNGQIKIMDSDDSNHVLGQDSIPDFSYRQDEIGELSVALREMTSALAKRIGAIENFAADVAHEIKNPLTSLRSAVETAVVVTDPKRQKKLMQVIKDDVDRLDRLITDISSASRLDAQLKRDMIETIDITKMLQTLISFYNDDTYKKETTVKVVLDPNIQTGLFVEAVESRIVQVIQNLIVNALSFSPKDGTVFINATSKNNQVEISVEDEGKGIPKGKLEAIFDRFYTERPKDEKFGTHSGLGLSISKQIIEAHHGKIWAENKTDDNGKVVGARLVFQLPVIIESYSHSP